jgi:hypothetical protein
MAKRRRFQTRKKKKQGTRMIPWTPEQRQRCRRMYAEFWPDVRTLDVRETGSGRPGARIQIIPTIAHP